MGNNEFEELGETEASCPQPVEWGQGCAPCQGSIPLQRFGLARRRQNNKLYVTLSFLRKRCSCWHFMSPSVSLNPHTTTAFSSSRNHSSCSVPADLLPAKRGQGTEPPPLYSPDESTNALFISSLKGRGGFVASPDSAQDNSGWSSCRNEAHREIIQHQCMQSNPGVGMPICDDWVSPCPDSWGCGGEAAPGVQNCWQVHILWRMETG